MPLCSAQQPASDAVITDTATWSQFGIPNQFKLADTGDVCFTSANNTALFQFVYSAILLNGTAKAGVFTSHP